MRQRFWLAPVIVFVVALAVYLRTAPPGLTWAHDSADGGDLIAAALVRGVPHPSGYPTFILLARLFTRLPWHTPAWQVTLISMLSGAAAAALTAATVQRLTAQTDDTSVSELASGHPSDEDTEEPAVVWRSSSVSSLLFVTPAIIAGLVLGVFPLVLGTGDRGRSLRLECLLGRVGDLGFGSLAIRCLVNVGGCGRRCVRCCSWQSSHQHLANAHGSDLFASASGSTSQTGQGSDQFCACYRRRIARLCVFAVGC